MSIFERLTKKLIRIAENFRNIIEDLKSRVDALVEERPVEVYIGYDPSTGVVSSDLTYADALELIGNPVEIIAYLDISNGAHKATTQTIYRDEDRYVRFDFANLGIVELDSDDAWSFISSDDIVNGCVRQFYATPQMYGAVGDGETDDTEAIQQCIYKNRNIFFPEGTYRITAPLIMPEGRTIRGGNQYNTMIFCDKCDGIHFEKNAERIVIRDIAFREFRSPAEYKTAKENGFPDGRHKAFTFAEAVVHIVFDNVWTRYFSDTIFYANGVGFINNIYLQNSTFEYGGKNCVEFMNDVGSQINDIVIRNCNVTMFEEDGICATGYNVSVETCSIQACRNGVRIDGDMSATGKSSHSKGVVIRNNYFEQIRQSYIWVNAHYDTKASVHNYVSALTIMGNYGGAFGTLDTDENGNYYPAVRFTVTNPNNVGLKAHKWNGRCLIGGLFYAANDFLTNNSKILIDGGSLLYDDCVIITDARFGNYAAETIYDENGNIEARVPYTLVNMASATIISRYIKYVDTLKLYEGFIPEGATVTNEKVVLPAGTSLYYNLVKKGVYRMVFTLEGTPTNASVTVYGYHKDGTKIKLRTIKYNDAGQRGIGWDTFNNINAQSYKDFESYDLVFNSGDNGMTIYNPVVNYITQ